MHMLILLLMQNRYYHISIIALKNWMYLKVSIQSMYAPRNDFVRYKGVDTSRQRNTRSHWRLQTQLLLHSQRSEVISSFLDTNFSIRLFFAVDWLKFTVYIVGQVFAFATQQSVKYLLLIVRLAKRDITKYHIVSDYYYILILCIKFY